MLGPLLPPEVLARRAALPRTPAPIVLEGTRVVLRPLDRARDVEALHAISSGAPVRIGGRATDAYDADAMIWRYMSGGPFADAAALDVYLAATEAAPDARPFTVFDRATDHPIGVACFLANVPEHLKIELGSIWYTPVAQGTGANTEATLLLADHAFALGYQRLEWKCNALNERSRRAALALGFRFEGVQEAHYVVKGRRRDTAWYRILAAEWPEVRPRIVAMLSR